MSKKWVCQKSSLVNFLNTCKHIFRCGYAKQLQGCISQDLGWGTGVCSSSSNLINDSILIERPWPANLTEEIMSKSTTKKFKFKMNLLFGSMKKLQTIPQSLSAQVSLANIQQNALMEKLKKNLFSINALDVVKNSTYFHTTI